MGYSPRGGKESDMTERLHYILPPMRDSTLGTTGKKKKRQNSYTSASCLFSAQPPPRCLIKPLRKQLLWFSLHIPGGSQVAPAVKNLPSNAGDAGSIPGLGRSPGGGHDNPLQQSCLENLMDRGVWQDTVHRVTKSWTRLKQLSTHPSGTEIVFTRFL